MPPMRLETKDRTYWRSREQQAGDPTAKAFAEREFPEGASELPDVSRRSMMKLLGASLSLAGIAACRRPVEKIVPFVNSPENMIPGVPRYFATTMPLGGEGTLEAFLMDAREQTSGDWDTRYMAPAFIEYIQQGFKLPPGSR